MKSLKLFAFFLCAGALSAQASESVHCRISSVPVVGWEGVKANAEIDLRGENYVRGSGLSGDQFVSLAFGYELKLMVDVFPKGSRWNRSAGKLAERGLESAEIFANDVDHVVLKAFLQRRAPDGKVTVLAVNGSGDSDTFRSPEMLDSRKFRATGAAIELYSPESYTAKAANPKLEETDAIAAAGMKAAEVMKRFDVRCYYESN